MNQSIRLAVIAGFTLTIGTILGHGFVMQGAIPGIRHPSYITYALELGVALLVIGTIVACIKKHKIAKLGFWGIGIGAVLFILAPTVC